MNILWLPDMVGMLLQRGADPNEKFSVFLRGSQVYRLEVSAWSFFLGVMRKSHEACCGNIRAKLILAVEEMIQHGARHFDHCLFSGARSEGTILRTIFDEDEADRLADLRRRKGFSLCEHAARWTIGWFRQSVQ